MSYKNPVPGLPDDVSEGRRKQQGNLSEKGYPMYDNVYFAFIDVLGFRQTFDEHREDPKKQFASDYGDVFSYFSTLLQHSRLIEQTQQRRATFPRAGQTSDSLYFYTDRPDHLAEFIKIYLHFSLYAMSQKVFFRGGIAKGSLFINQPHQFYGDCVIKAYLLESKIAKYPQIALDKDTYEALKDVPELSGALREEKNLGRYYLEPFFRNTKKELTAITDLDSMEIRRAEKKAILKHIEDGKKDLNLMNEIIQNTSFLTKKSQS